MHKPGGAPRRLNPRKLLLSKWTAAQPRNKEKHFLVTELLLDDDEQTVIGVALQAVMTENVQQLPWQALQDAEVWRIGWK
ncbi:MAG: TIGR02450 family Trp-rich protein [Janthinobacterium lividum]